MKLGMEAVWIWKRLGFVIGPDLEEAGVWKGPGFERGQGFRSGLDL